MNNPFNEKTDLYRIFDKDCCDIEKNQIFIYNGDLLQCIAFLEGATSCKAIKRKITKIGFNYTHHIECYIRYIDTNATIGEMRSEKDSMIEDLIQWKLKNPIQEK